MSKQRTRERHDKRLTMEKDTAPRSRWAGPVGQVCAGSTPHVGAVRRLLRHFMTQCSRTWPTPRSMWRVRTHVGSGRLILGTRLRVTGQCKWSRYPRGWRPGALIPTLAGCRHACELARHWHRRLPPALHHTVSTSCTPCGWARLCGCFWSIQSKWQRNCQLLVRVLT